MSGTAAYHIAIADDFTYEQAHTTSKVPQAAADARPETGKWDGTKKTRPVIRARPPFRFDVHLRFPSSCLRAKVLPPTTATHVLHRTCIQLPRLSSVNTLLREHWHLQVAHEKLDRHGGASGLSQPKKTASRPDSIRQSTTRAGTSLNNNKMSSLSRRACYKCGNVGHYAEVCSSSERLCYNCKQPGHESNSCPHPRTTETKQCYHCQGLGHVQADCPTLRISGGASGGRCYSCGEPGHLARNCPTPNAGPAPPVGRGAGGPARGGYGGGFRGGFSGNRSAMCYKCGGPNHFARDCQAQAMKCYACGKLGHISRDCTAPNGGPLNAAGKTCYRCGEAGHISRDCPQSQVESVAPVVNGDAPVAPEGVMGVPLAPAAIAA
nr:zinc finger protein gis2 [Quercus suber]